MHISHRVTPNIHVSVAWENVRVFRLSGAHLTHGLTLVKTHGESTEAAIFPAFPPHSPGERDLAVLLHDVMIVVVGQRPHQAEVADLDELVGGQQDVAGS